MERTFGSMENALKVRDIADWLEQWAPRHLAESYDNVGLLWDAATWTTKVLVSLIAPSKWWKRPSAKGANPLSATIL